MFCQIIINMQGIRTVTKFPEKKLKILFVNVTESQKHGMKEIKIVCTFLPLLSKGRAV